MTGATMTATRAGKEKEGRDPSPSLKPASSGSSDEVEPWDERPSNKTTRDEQEPSMMLGDVMKSAAEFLGVSGAEDDRLEDGDLPTLSLKKERVKGQYVSGERSTRPLSPPSTKGLEVDVKDNDPPMRRKRVPTPRTAKQAAAQRQFWAQLNASPSPFEADSSRDQDDQDRNPEEGPDDEMMAARRRSRANELDNVPKQGDETTVDEDYYGRKVANANSYEEGGGTCIEYTLASIGDICGTGKSSAPIKDSDRPTRIREVRELREDMVVDDAEEHTAIEVEYVDPGPIPRRSTAPSTPQKAGAASVAAAAAIASAAAVPTKKKQEKRANKDLPTSRALDGESVELKESETSAWSSSRKNAVLAAMARKAKQDFEKHENEVSKQGSTPVSPRRAASPADHDNASDIYNSFSPSEKRKFLKLINLGLTPTESTTRVVEERQNKDNVKSPGSTSKKRFSFWKKSAKVDASRSPPLSPRTPAVAKDAQSVSSTAAVGEAEDGAVRQGESEAAMAAPATPPRDEGSDVVVSKAYSPPAKDSSAIPTAASSPGGEDTPNELQAQDNESGEMRAPESADSEEIEQDELQKAVAAGVIAAGAAAVGVAAVTANQSADSASEAPVETTPPSSYAVDDDDSSEEDDSVRGQFPRSGVNYYDGVRRELPEEDDSEDEFGEIYSPSGKTSKASRLASLTGTLSPQSQGFSSLKESERNITVDDEGLSNQQKSISKSLSPLGRHSKSGSSGKDLSSPLSPGGSAKRRYLGIPMLNTGKGFAPLEEDEDSPAAKSTQVNPVTNRDIQLPEKEIDSAVAAAAVTAAAVTAQKSQEFGASSDPRPLNSMEDPFFGLDSEEVADTAKLPKDQDKSEVNSQALPKGQISEVDTSLDSYLESATMQSYAGSHQDQGSLVTGSVISGKSGYTAGTGMTGHTQSSRKRRPGAAKQRIAKAKEADKSVPSKKGWHESIRAAAATNNRVWDPQKGWVDYKDPDEDVQDISSEKLHISLDGVSMRSPRAVDDTNGQAGHDDSSGSPAVSVRFPPGWEKERNEMLSPGQAAKSSPREPSVPDSEQSQKAPVQGSDSKVLNDSPKPQGWEASIREASAEVSKDGGLDKNVVESSPLSPRKAPEANQDDDSTDGKDEKTSPSNIFAALTKVPSESKIRDAREFAESETRSVTSRSTASRSQDVKVDNTVSSKPPTSTTKDASEHSTEDSDQAVVPGVGEKYVQLGDNGSVKAVKRDTRKKKVSSEREDKHPFHPPTLRIGSASKAARPDTIYDDDKAPLLTEDSSDSTGELGQTVNAVVKESQTVKVVKEKVDEDEFSLFTANEGSASIASPSRRRSTGPVDVDEVDDLDTESESEDGDEDGMWEPDSYMRGNVSPGMFVKPRSERSAELGGFAAAISPTKTPPKLQKSRRDTSPIRSVRGGNSESKTPREVMSPASPRMVMPSPEASEASPRMVMSSPDASPGREDQNRTIEPSVSLGDDSVGSSSVKLLAQKWEIRAKHGTQIVHDQSGDSFEYDERQVTALGDFGPDTNEQAEWPDHYDKQPSQSTGNREWKSFLGKKVQAEAESAASATLEETKQRERSLGASKPGIPRAPGVPKRIPGSERGTTDEHGDSSMSFGDAPSDADASPAMSSAAARRRERALQQSSPGGFSDVSPIPPGEDSFGVDDVRMERVSDTGTAVEQSSFMKRLSACAAPLSRAFTQNGAGGVPSSHLDFMRTNPAAQSCSPNSSGRFVPAGMCGKQDIINEDEEESDEEDSKRSLEHKEMEMEPSPTSPTSQILKEVKQRSSSRGRTRPDPIANVTNDASSSVVSEDFGARTSYLEAIALRSAVSSGSKKSRRRRRSADSQSTVSDATSDSKLSHSERWQAFLERKASQTASPPGSRAHSSAEISKAAERYASEKMEEMMEVMASSRSKSTPRSFRSKDVEETLDTSYGDGSADSPLSPYRMTATDGDRSMSSSKKSKPKKKSESAKAAEELAAARVEAMMAAMTSSNLDEGEI